MNVDMYGYEDRETWRQERVVQERVRQTPAAPRLHIPLIHVSTYQ